ncbi:MAG: beta-phosphoglucomutase family hydrolase [Rhodomicrobium sp.]
MGVFAIRHGETAWSVSGQHTSLTDIPLTDKGRRLAKQLGPVLAAETFVLVLVSPLQRARETCALAGLGARAVVDPDLVEWNYGEYEGLTPEQIHKVTPGWVIFRDGCPGGETPEQVCTRVDRVIARVRAAGGDVAVFAHGHVLRVVAARWIGLPVECGQHFLLDAGTLCVLSHYRNIPAVKVWNRPIARNTAICGRSTRIRKLRALFRFRGAEQLTPTLAAAVQQAMPAQVRGELSMPQSLHKCAINSEHYDAVLLDLDGVITNTASIHAACWKQMFDEYLQKRATRTGEAFRPFDLSADYRLYVDGKPRFDGVRDFLASRNIHIPGGNADDPPETETVAGLGNRKNSLFDKIIEDKGVQPYEGSVKLINQLRRDRFKISVVTSSHNCTAVLRAANLDAFFDARVDGNTIDAEHLAGKPAPDTYLMAAKLVSVEPLRAVVIEDAIAGVEAGFNGHFGLVIGVARSGNAEELLHHGANLVVKDLGELVD